jgi:hypothetical protein
MATLGTVLFILSGIYFLAKAKTASITNVGLQNTA